jgi:hypothetical protein
MNRYENGEKRKEAQRKGWNCSSSVKNPEESLKRHVISAMSMRRGSSWTRDPSKSNTRRVLKRKW